MLVRSLVTGVLVLTCFSGHCFGQRKSIEELWGNISEEQRREHLRTFQLPRGEEGPLPIRKRTPEEQEEHERKLDWFYRAKYGVMFHYLTHVGSKGDHEFAEDEWDDWVDAVDVNAFADQCVEAGIGYVLLTIGQQKNYYCSPNPVYEDLWGFKPGRYSSRRDLPMDLYKALKPHGIRLMLYVTSHPFATWGDGDERSRAVGWKWRTPGDRTITATDEASQKWCRALAWWSKHYGKACSGWWVDGNQNFVPGHAIRVNEALRSGNSDTIVGTVWNNLSDYYHGHMVRDWNDQQTIIPPQGPSFRWRIYSEEELLKPVSPEQGRWTPYYNQQWHALVYLGSLWGRADTNKSKESVVAYADKVIRRGGVITVDVGVYSKPRPDGKDGPFLIIPDGHFEQIKAVRDAVKEIRR